MSGIKLLVVLLRVQEAFHRAQAVEVDQRVEGKFRRAREELFFLVERGRNEGIVTREGVWADPCEEAREDGRIFGLVVDGHQVVGVRAVELSEVDGPGVARPHLKLHPVERGVDVAARIEIVQSL